MKLVSLSITLWSNIAGSVLLLNTACHKSRTIRSSRVYDCREDKDVAQLEFIVINILVLSPPPNYGVCNVQELALTSIVAVVRTDTFQLHMFRRIPRGLPRQTAHCGSLVFEISDIKLIIISFSGA